MKTLLKNLNFGALLALASVVTLTVSWKNHETNSKAANWYQVQLRSGGSTSTLSDFEIVGAYPGGSPSGNCNTTTKPEICAVYMDLNGAPIPTDLQDAEDHGFDTDVRRYKQD
ncbi:hypothetical protein [Sphingobacterium multivorum]|uniref:hypothetical protein n=1 Tax=Sphingobacterium multivorum TaxID=28454 RepID=UPI0028A9C6B6|nr:hypothetical protein [Sphingobacterium multivorum]